MWENTFFPTRVCSIISNHKTSIAHRRRPTIPASTEEDSGEIKMATPFETLKREAVQLERQLEDKVARYQQVCLHKSKFATNIVYLLLCCSSCDQKKITNCFFYFRVVHLFSFPWNAMIDVVTTVSLEIKKIANCRYDS